MQTPLCVFWRWPPWLHTRGRKRRGAKQRHRCARPYSHAPTCRRGSSELGRRAHRAGAAAKGRGNKVAPCTRPYSHAHLSAGRPSSGRRAHRPSKRHQLCTPELPRPHLSVGGVRATRRRAQRAGQRHDEAMGVMRGGDGSWRLLQDKNLEQSLSLATKCCRVHCQVKKTVVNVSLCK